MGRALRYINILLVFLLCATPAKAEEALVPLTFKGQYIFALGFIPFGKLDINFTHSSTQYNATSDVHSTGIARMFVQHDSKTTSRGAGSDYVYGDTFYESHYQTRKKKRYVKWVRKDGKTSEEEVIPPDNRDIRPAVAEELKTNAFDPLAFGLALRSNVATALKEKQKSFTLNFYDGRRLTEATFTYVGYKIVKIHGKKYSTHEFTATRKPIAGFTKGDMEDFEEPDPLLHIFFSYDERLIPIRAEADVGFGVVSATLVQ